MALQDLLRGGLTVLRHLRLIYYAMRISVVMIPRVVHSTRVVLLQLVTEVVQLHLDRLRALIMIVGVLIDVREFNLIVGENS